MQEPDMLLPRGGEMARQARQSHAKARYLHRGEVGNTPSAPVLDATGKMSS